MLAMARVAGANAPAFVERPIGMAHRKRRGPVSPELTLRPSLSADAVVDDDRASGRVAGANAPAFVERCRGALPTC